MCGPGVSNSVALELVMLHCRETHLWLQKNYSFIDKIYKKTEEKTKANVLGRLTKNKQAKIEIPQKAAINNIYLLTYTRTLAPPLLD